MDQITDLSMPAPAEQGAHLAQAANPTSQVPNQNHPPYADMIIAAISALKDKDGSSRQAIAKYIEQVFPNLPPSHSSLLTNHLKRMKNSGELVMIKHSYALPGSVNFSFAGEFPPPAPAASNTVTTADASYSGVKRKPGRPAKARTDAQFQQPTSVPVSGAGFGAEPQAYSVAASGYHPEFAPYSGGAPGYAPDVQSYHQVGAPSFGSDVQAYPPAGTGQQPDVQPYPVGGPEPMFVSLGLDDGPVAVAPPPVVAFAPVIKRGRGRPPKGSTTNGPVVAAAVSGGEPTSLGKRARGRPAKPRSITEIMSNGGPKPEKARGRPRVTGLVVVPLAGGSPKPQGSPPKKGPMSSGRPRGRPPKSGGAVVAPPEGGVAPTRKSGRPARIGVARKISGKPMGRPRKVQISAPVTGVLVTDPLQLVAYQELKSKYEHIQLKVKQTSSVLRPCLNHEGATSALAALRELEALATGEVNNAEVNGQTQEPPTQLVHDHQENLF